MAEDNSGLPKSKGQNEALKRMDQSGKPLGWLSDLVRQIALQGQQKQTPGQQPMAQLGVPMPGQIGMPGPPQVPGFGVPVQPLPGMQAQQGQQQVGGVPKAPGAPQTPGGPAQAPSGGDIGIGQDHKTFLSGILKIIGMLGGGG